MMQRVLLVLVALVGCLVAGVLSDPKIGFVFSGGGSRVAQEIALMESLVTGTYLNGKPLIPSFAAGSSAGSLCAIGLNAILATQAGHTEYPYTWTDLKNLLFHINVSQVFDDSPMGIFKILTHNVETGYFLDTTPLRATLTGALTKMGFKFMRDLYIPTCVSVVEEDSGLPLRICSDDPKTRDLQIVDVVMASSAIPVIFPMQQIPGFNPGFGNGDYIDGGTGIDMIPVDTAYARNLDVVYILTRQAEFESKGSLPAAIRHYKILANLVSTFDDFMQGAFLSGLASASTTRIPSYAYIPVLPTNFGILDFGSGELQYYMTKNWTRANAPLCLNCRT